MILLHYKSPPDPESAGYYICTRCNRISKSGAEGGTIREGDPRVKPIDFDVLDEQETDDYISRYGRVVWDQNRQVYVVEPEYEDADDDLFEVESSKE